MEIIDAHVHIWPAGTTPPKVGTPYHGRADGEYLIAEMDRTGVWGAILITPRVLGTDNSYALAAVRAHPDRFLGVVGIVDHHRPAAEARRVAREAAAGRLHGIRVHPCFDPDLDLAVPALRPIWAACRAAGLPVCIHADPGQFGQVRALAESEPELDILIDHLGRLPLGQGIRSAAWLELADLAGYARVHLKLSSMPWLLRGSPADTALTPFNAAAFAAFGPDRVVWGADWPVLCGVGWTYDNTVALARRSPPAGHACTGFLAENARRLYRSHT